jgi:alkyl sulfatase BDS1-like metallo-beta-lactamase superfamily hydrolase
VPKRSPRRLLADTRAHAAARTLRVLRGIPDERLDQLLRTPARRLIISGIFRRLPALLDPGRAAALTTTVRWQVRAPDRDSVEVYDLLIDRGAARVVRGARAHAPGATVTVDARELLKLAIGSSNPLSAYFSGKLVLSGNLLTATSIAALIDFRRILAYDARR